METLMSDIQAETPATPVTVPVEGVSAMPHTEAGVILPVDPALAPPPGEAAPAPVMPAPEPVLNASVLVTSTAGPLETSFIRDELTAILFALKSGVVDGIERVKSLIQHVESKM